MKDRTFSSTSRRVEKINGGYLVHDSRLTDNGIDETKTFHPQRPPELVSHDLRSIVTGRPDSEEATGSRGLVGAMAHLSEGPLPR